MARISVVLLLGVAFLVLAPVASAQSCDPPSTPIAGPMGNGIDYIANGDPDGTTNCWSVFNATVGLGSMTCGFYPQWNSNNFEFNYGGDVIQGISVPATSPHTTFTSYSLVYFADFQDPSHDPSFNQLNVQVYDNTTHTVLASDHYDGSQPDLYCARREVPLYTGNLAGHSISVQFMGSRVSDTTHIRVGIVQLWGS